MADSRKKTAPSTVARFNARLVKLQQIRKYAAFLPAQSMTTEDFVRNHFLKGKIGHGVFFSASPAPIAIAPYPSKDPTIPPGLRSFKEGALTSSTEFSLFANPLPQLNKPITQTEQKSITPTYTRGHY